ncbi:MAG: hypothetical protein ABL919_12415 [Methylococcales bacterium]|nr:hypothetical protein [Methylococcaceae bacterium]
MNTKPMKVGRGEYLNLIRATLAISLSSFLSMPAYTAQIACPASGTVFGENNIVCAVNDAISIEINTTLLNTGTLGNSLLSSTGLGGTQITNAGIIENTGQILNRGASLKGLDNTITNLSTGLIKNNGSIENDNLYFSFFPLSRGSFINLGTLENHFVILNHVNSLFINGGSLTSDHRFTNEGTFDNQSGGLIINSNDLSNSLQGTLINSGGLINQAAGIFSNQGTLTNKAGGIVENNGVLSNKGTIANETGGILSNNGSLSSVLQFSNSGQFNNLISGKTTSQVKFDNNSGGQINNSGELIIGLSTLSLENVVLSNSGTLTNNSSGRIINYGQIVNTANAEINNAGEISIVPGNLTMDNSGKFTNQLGGKLTTEYGNIVNNLSGGSFVNAGNLVNKFIINNDGDLNNQADATFTNRAFRNHSTGRFVNAGAMTSGILIENSGHFEVTNTGSLLPSPSSQSAERYIQFAGDTVLDGQMSLGNIDIQSGTLSGVGSLKSTNTPIKIGTTASVNPGDSFGTLTLLGDVDFSGKLVVEIDSLSSFDILKQIGTTNFLQGSNVEFVFDSGFKATDGSSLTFLDANSIFGSQFLSYYALGLPAGVKWDISTNAVSDTANVASMTINFHVAAVPLPAGLPLFASGLGMLFAGRRARKGGRIHAVSA